jgi:AraC family transcriptional regulator, arabinose operon regulatory protein
MSDRVVPEHWLTICVGGGADFLIGGRPYRLEPGGLLLVPPHVHRQARHDPADPLRVYTLRFTARLYGVLDISVVYGLPVAMSPAPPLWGEIVQTAARIVGELAAAGPGHALAANGDCARLITLLWRAAGGRSVTAGTRTTRPAALARLAPVFQVIQARYAERLTLRDLADTLYLHPAYFSALFRETTGLPPLRYLARYRLDRVRELLLSTDLTVREIAMATGYHDSFYLAGVFRRAEGVSPSACRKHKKNPDLG